MRVCGYFEDKDDVMMNDLENAILNPKSKPRHKGRGRMVHAISEDGERFADGVFVGIQKI